MAYQVIILAAAEADLERLDGQVRSRILRRLVWLRDNAHQLVHHRLVNMPDDLAGLCRYRVGDYRVLYWHDSAGRVIKVYRIQHRREVYEDIE